MSDFYIGYRAIENAVKYKNSLAQKDNELDDVYAANSQLRSVIANLESQVNDLVQQVQQLQLALAVEKAHAAGFNAYIKASKAQHPDSPIFADSGQRYKQSGNVKSNGRLLYEAAFDAEARKLGIKNPVQYRAD